MISSIVGPRVFLVLGSPRASRARSSVIGPSLHARGELQLNDRPLELADVGIDLAGDELGDLFRHVDPAETGLGHAGSRSASRRWADQIRVTSPT
jgi:hypothetical protein